MIEVIVKAGGHPVGIMHIQRIDDIRRIDDMALSGYSDYDDVYKYSALLRLHNIDEMPKVATFEHRYGDEWPIIVRKALEAIGIGGCEDHEGTMERQNKRD